MNHGAYDTIQNFRRISNEFSHSNFDKIAKQQENEQKSNIIKTKKIVTTLQCDKNYQLWGHLLQICVQIAQLNCDSKF